MSSEVHPQGLPRRDGWRFALLITILLAFGLRLYHLDGQSLWMDEGSTVHLAMASLERLAGRLPRSIAHPPLYYYLLHLWMLLAGKSELSLRYLSLLFGTLLVPSTYRAGRRWLGAKRALAALWAALITSLAPVQIYYSQETRMYTLTAFLNLWGFYLFTLLLERREEKKWWIAYILFTSLSLYAHYYSFFVVLTENLIALGLLLRRHKGRSLLLPWLLSQSALALLFLPWARAPLGRLTGGFLEVRSQLFGASPSSFPDFLRQVMVGLSLGPTIRESDWYTWLATALLLLLLIVGALRRDIGRREMPLLYFLVPVLLAFLVDQRFPHFVPRYLLLVTPGYYLTLACAVEGPLTTWRGKASLTGFLILLALFTYGLFNNYFDPTYARDDYRSLYARVVENSHPDEVIILDAPWQAGTFRYYYLGRYGGKLPRYNLPQGYPPGQETTAALEAIAQKHAGVWLVLYGQASADPQGLVEGWLNQNGYLTSSEWFGEVRLSHYLLPLPSGFAASDIPNPTDIGFSHHLTLLGYAQEPQALSPGESLYLTLFWEAKEEMEIDYHLSLRLSDATEEDRAQNDFPFLGGAHPPSTWERGEVVRDLYRFPIPSETPPGRYKLTLIVYSPETLKPLDVTTTGRGSVVLDSVEITPLSAPSEASLYPRNRQDPFLKGV